MTPRFCAKSSFLHISRDKLPDLSKPKFVVKIMVKKLLRSLEMKSNLQKELENVFESGIIERCIDLLKAHHDKGASKHHSILAWVGSFC